MDHKNIRGWTDLDQTHRFRNMPPNVIIRASAIAAGEWDGMAGDQFNGDTDRRMVYVDTSGNKWYMTLRLQKHPVGAGALTIYSGGTSQCKGRLMKWSGAFSQDADDAKIIAGCMLSHYCDSTGVDNSSNEPEWATTINEGDYFWVIKEGHVLLLADSGAIGSSGLNIVTGNGGGTDGAVRTSVTTILSLDEIKENILRSGKCIGWSEEAKGATETGYVRATLILPSSYLELA